MTDADKAIQQFLYLLMRDYLPTGKVEVLINDHIVAAKDEEVIYSNEHLASYALELTQRLLEPRPLARST